MSPTELSVGIDFGTTKSVIAWWNPATAQASCINEEPTPSLVYFHRDGAVLIGKEVQEILEDRQHLQSEEYEGFAVGATEIARAVAHLRQHRPRHLQHRQQVGVPAHLSDVIEQRAAGVAWLGDVLTPAGEARYQPRVDGAKGQLAGGGAPSDFRVRVEQPLELRP